MRKKKHEEHVNHERWLVSYADFITLLFAFFVTLYAISQVDAKKMGKLVDSMQTAFDSKKVFPPGSEKLSLSDGQSKGAEQQKLVESITPAIAPAPTLASVQRSIRSKLIHEGFVVGYGLFRTSRFGGQSDRGWILRSRARRIKTVLSSRPSGHRGIAASTSQPSTD